MADLQYSVNCFRCARPTNETNDQGRVLIYCSNCRPIMQKESDAEWRWAEIERMDWPEIIDA